jgi:hypothetical protein
MALWRRMLASEVSEGVFREAYRPRIDPSAAAKPMGRSCGAESPAASSSPQAVSDRVLSEHWGGGPVEGRQVGEAEGAVEEEHVGRLDVAVRHPLAPTVARDKREE